MAIDKSKLGPNQLEWLEGEELLRQTYPSSEEITVPDEKILGVLKKCPVIEQGGISCFQEGYCLNPEDPMCAERERK